MTRRALGAALAIASVVAGAAGVVVLVTGRPGSNGDDPVSQLIYFLNGPANAIVGGLLVWRLPRNWAGWTLIGVGAVSGFDALCQGVLSHWLLGESWTNGIARWAGWFDNWMWPSYLAALLLVMIKFSGTAARTRWLRRIAWAGIGLAFACMALASTVDKSLSTGPHHLDTAVDLGGSYAVVEPILGSMLILALVTLICGLIAMLLHWRRSDGVERAQARWLLWAFITVIVTLLAVELAQAVISGLGLHARALYDVFSVVQELSLLTIPLAIYVSVTRYGLFEIDRVVSRTATYTVLVVLLTLGYASLVTLTTRLLPDRLGSFGVAAATLAVAALFLPARRLLLRLMDRRFNRGRVDADRVVATFAEQMRREDSVDPSGSDLLTAVGRVFQPSSASVWLIRSSS